MATKTDGSGYPRICRLLLFCSMAAMILVLAPAPANAQQHRYTNKTDFCNALGKTIQASSGAQMYCFGAQRNGPGLAILQPAGPPPKGLANVDAANNSEDRTGSGAYIGGQSETSIAASGKYVVEAWNDGTAFFSACGAPMYKEELTGYGFSRDGGVTFTDYGGLPNNNCSTGSRWSGDPSVEVYVNSGLTYFYISSLFSTVNGLQVAVAACQVTGSTLTCGQPTIVASSNNSISFSSLDKDYLTIDQANKRLYITFTDFADFNDPSGNTIQLAACDISRPLAPICSNGNAGAPPYLVVDLGDSVSFCEVEGAYPAVDPASGDLYVAFEYNWATNFFGAGACVDTNPTKVVTAFVRSSCLTDPTVGPSTCSPPFLENSNIIISTDATIVPGYNRTLMNDFPRIAVSDAHGSVSVVWNDARNRPLGDIFLQSYRLGSLTYIQGSPVQLSDDDSSNRSSGAAFMPGLKNVSSSGKLNVTWYDRRGKNAGTGKTDIFGVTDVNPLTSGSPTNKKFTNVSTDWLATSSVIIPNFGDYTDNYVSSSDILYVAWSDGRTGVPQPEEAHEAVH